MGGERKSLGRFVKKGETGCHAALNSRTDARPLFQHCPLFHCRFIALKSRTFVVKSRTTFAIKFVRDLNAKSTPMGDCGRGCLGRGAPQGICDPSLGRASQTQFRKHRRSGKSTGLEPQYSLQTPATVPATASDLFPTSLEARSQAG